MRFRFLRVMATRMAARVRGFNIIGPHGKRLIWAVCMAIDMVGELCESDLGLTFRIPTRIYTHSGLQRVWRCQARRMALCRSPYALQSLRLGLRLQTSSGFGMRRRLIVLSPIYAVP